MEGGASSESNGFEGLPWSNAGALPPNPAPAVQVPPPIPAAEQNFAANGGGGGGGGGPMRQQDHLMPITNVIRIMRKALPTHAKITDDAKVAVQDCVSEFISFITSEANDRCQREQRRTITAEDLVWAMSKLGFEDYIEPLSIYLHRYREHEGDHRGSLRGESLPTIKRQAPQLLQPPPPPPHDNRYPELFAPPQVAGGLPPIGSMPLPSYHMPPPAVTALPLPKQTHPHLEAYGEGMEGYYMGMYSGAGSSGGGDGANSPTQFAMRGFDHCGGSK